MLRLLSLEVPHEPVSNLLFVRVATSSVGDVECGHSQHRSLAGHCGAFANQHAGKRNEVVHLVDRCGEAEWLQIGWQLAFTRDEHPTMTPEFSNHGSLLLEVEPGLAYVVRSLPRHEAYEEIRRVRVDTAPSNDLAIRCEALWMQVGKLVVPGIGDVAAPDGRRVALRCANRMREWVHEGVGDLRVLGVVEDDGRFSDQFAHLHDGHAHDANQNIWFEGVRTTPHTGIAHQHFADERGFAASQATNRLVLDAVSIEELVGDVLLATEHEDAITSSEPFSNRRAKEVHVGGMENFDEDAHDKASRTARNGWYPRYTAVATRSTKPKGLGRLEPPTEWAMTRKPTSMPQPLTILCAAKLHANQLERHLEVLERCPDVGRIVVVRSSPVPERLSKLENASFGNGSIPHGVLRMYQEINRVVDRTHVDWVIAFNPVPWGTVAQLAAHSRGLPTCLSVIGRDYEQLQTAWGWPFLKVLRRATCVTATGKKMADGLARMGIEQSRLHVLPHSVDLERFRPGSGSHVYDVISVGQLIARKRMDLLIEATKLLRDRGRRIKVGILGRGPEEARLRALVQTAGLEEQVTFLGYRDDVETLLRQARTFVLVSDGEGVPFALMEAMAVGVVPVVTPVGTIQDWVHADQNGIIVPRGDARTLADRLYGLLQPESAELGKMQKRLLEERSRLSFTAGIDVWTRIFAAARSTPATRAHPSNGVHANGGGRASNEPRESRAK